MTTLPRTTSTRTRTLPGPAWMAGGRFRLILSPDMNVLDLGFFNSIQAIQHTKRALPGLDGLITTVSEAFAEMEPTKLDKCFVTLQSVMEACMMEKGGNAYAIPHLNKDKLIARGEVPRSLPCSGAAFAAAQDGLNREAVI